MHSSLDSHNNRIGVLFINLGTPEKPTTSAIRAYLKEFLSDRRVIEVNPVIWKVILNAFILPLRAPKLVPKYESIWSEERGAPLLYHTQDLAENIKKFLSSNISVGVAMTYGSPSINDEIKKFGNEGIERILFVPLYPQYSGSTTGSVYDAVSRALNKIRNLPEIRFIKSYYEREEYIGAIVKSILRHWDEHGKPDRLLCSFHGLPQDMIDAGDPYYEQCVRTVELIKGALPQGGPQVDLAFQSKFGRAKWIEPATESVIRSYPTQGVKNVHIIAPGFAADCIETIDEIDRELREIFLENGGEKFSYIPCLNGDEFWAQGLANIINDHISNWSQNVKT